MSVDGAAPGAEAGRSLTAEANARPTPRSILGGSIYVGITALVAAVAAWPIYSSMAYVILVAVAVVVAAGIAVLATWRRFGGWIVAAMLAGAFVVLAVPLAVPSRIGGIGDILRGLGEALAGIVFAWKDLVTVELPVGSYRNLLVPALIVFLVGTCVALLLAWRTDRWANAAVPVGLALAGFGLFFGRTAVSAPLALGPVSLHAPVETVTGVAALVAALLWLAWRTHDERVRALHRAATASGVRVSRRPSRTDRRRTALGAGMVVLALVAAVAVVPWAARGAQRDVLRAAAGPEREIAAAVSPLSDYRAQFTGDRADQVLFRVSGEALPERVRLATLDTYDGEIFRAGGGDEATDAADAAANGAPDAEAAFVRVPAVRGVVDGEAVDARIEIEALEGIWMPTAGDLSSVEFAGDRAAALSDGFYYSAGSRAGVQTAGGGLEAGDAYRLRATEPAPSALAEIEAPGGDPASVEAPDNLQRWVEEHAAGEDGAALAELVALLRERGYLSHALQIPEDDPPSWAAALAGYSFQPSASGHSLARIDTLFTRLLERESDPRAEASGNYVAAVGDDEQFAVATALIAGELGFPARVVVGARLASSDSGAPTCDDGACRARDLSAWTEVLASDGAWVPVDVTPQWSQSPSLEVTEQRDPENVTEVRPDSVEEVVPPEPTQEDSARGDDEEEAAGADLAWLWPVLRVTGLVLLALAILLGPFIVVVGAKAARRRSRRSASTPSARIAGGWEEYVDAGVDTGREAPRVLTRSELALAYGTASGAQLADVADRAVFSREATTQDEAEEFWRIVDAERRTMRRERGIWRRLLAAVSLRSFLRVLAPRTPVRMPRIIERGRRRTPREGRTTS